ncbi:MULTISPECIES: VIT domain-containing protein [Pseudanabaena]|uniref:VIT domain-containing protein n=1 Tax=Pseudanabaena TaxID=1152 RepID=UPI0024783CC1|nr:MULTISPECIES: VIT domain-containing protein [Pseudanabaena]MEA5485196.1 VIT domain-containing protein [Pseudanabaena sp. CCNP1317]WGS72672.1 VIT domain-containing protein [Pseudanabaena galeata CCNP1313]
MKSNPIYIALPAAMILVGAISHRTLAQSSPINQPQPITSSMVTSGIIEPVSDRNSSNESTQKRPVGGLYVQTPDRQQQAFTLTNTDVKGKISGNISRVEVTQTFQNPYDKPLEAIYVFPLPDQAAVDDMEIKIGDRVIKGEIKKREEAKEIYDRARKEGRTAGLLEQERDNIFTQSLANIKPGEQIKVTIRYTESLKFEKGDYEFVFPMVVGPRYIPGAAIDAKGNTIQVPDASRINPPVLRPETRSGNDITVSLQIDAGVPIRNLYSTSHRIDVQNNSETVQLKLATGDNIPNKDLIVRYKVSGDRTEPTILTTNTDQGSHFATYLIPAIAYRSDQIVPKDVVFLMDTSGSQSGDPIIKSRELMRRFINGLNPNDTFTIIDFSNTTRQLSSYPLQNNATNRQKAMKYIDQVDANGGTELMNGINAVMKFPTASDGRIRSVVLITDGYIGNDNEVIAAVQKNLKPGNRLYSFGVGSSVNRYLLERVAEMGRGTARVVRQDEPTQEVAEKFFRQINNPVLTNIQVKWEGDGSAPEIYPSNAPDLFAEQPLVLFGKKGDRANGKLKITGIAAGGERYEHTLDVNFDSGNSNLGIAQLWGRARIKDLMNQMFGGEVKSLVDAVTQTALNYRLLSQYTAFVAVSDEVRVNPDGSKMTVQVPVEMPQGVDFGMISGEMADTQALKPAAPSPLASPRQSTIVTGRVRGGTITGKDQLNTRLRTEVDSVNSPSEASKVRKHAPISQIQVVSITGLTGMDVVAAQQAIAQQLQSINVPAGVRGTVVLEIPIQNGRLTRFVLDDVTSTVSDKNLVEMIKRSLQNVILPSTAKGSIRLTLSVKL